MIDMRKVINPMTKAEAEEWCKALESGEYAQAKHKLITSTGYCCLGVEVVVHAKQCMDVTSPYALRNNYGDVYRLPVTTQSVLTDLNDYGEDVDSGKKPYDFPMIAAHIRAEIIPHLPD